MFKLLFWLYKFLLSKINNDAKKIDNKIIKTINNPKIISDDQPIRTFFEKNLLKKISKIEINVKKEPRPDKIKNLNIISS